MGWLQFVFDPDVRHLEPKPFPISEQKLVVTQPIPEIIDAGLHGMAEEYSRVAKSIGLSSPAIRRAEILLSMQRDEMVTYDYQTVCRYMDSLVGLTSGTALDAGQTGWGWRPLRESDFMDGRWPGSTVGCFEMDRQYNKPVPLEALALAEKVVGYAKDVKLIVADRFTYLREIETRGLQGDPFLAAVIPGSDPIVFAVWDEPGFRSFRNRK